MPRRAPTLDDLNDRQRRFAQEYLLDFNGTQAAIRAGYSKRTAAVQASNLLRKPKVSALLKTHLAAAAEERSLTAQRVEEELAHVAFVDVGEAYDAEGRLLPLAKMPARVRRAITAFEEEALFDAVEVPDGTSTKRVRVQVGVVRKIRLAGKVEALGLAAKRLGLLVERSELKVTRAAPDPTDDELAELARLRHQVLPNRTTSTTPAT